MMIFDILAPNGESVYQLPYWDIWNLEGYIFLKILPLSNYGMDYRFSGNNGNIVCKTI